MVATYEFLGRQRGGAAVGSLPRAQVLAAVAAIEGMVAVEGGFDWRVGDRVYMNVRLDAGGDVVSGVRFHLQYAMATRLADCRKVALAVVGAIGWELFDPQKDCVVAAAGGAGRPWWRFW